MTGFLLLLAAMVTGLAGAAPAMAAASLSEVQTALASNPVFVDPDAEAADLVDTDRVRSAIGSEPLVVAVLPASTGTRAGGCSELPSDIRGNRTVFVLCGYQPVAGSFVLRKGAAEAIVNRLSRPARTREGFTSAIVSFVNSAKDAPRASSGSSSSSDSSDSSSNSGWIVGGIAVAAVGGGLYYSSRRRKKRSGDEMAADKAEIESLYSRLGSDITTLDPGDDATARQALTDASERYTSAGGLRSRATTTGELAAVRDTVIEGLHATRTVRQRLGLDLGPAIPEPPGVEAQPQPVSVGGQTFQASPSYAPGQANYFPGGTVGGTYVPGGWYQSRFWEGALLGGLAGTLFGGGFGGFGGFGYGYGSGYGSGYDSGYDRGYEQSQDSGDGSGQGGDWGSSGGDWGGGGGGDWGGGGGGGGDWGGGGGGGGDSGGGGSSW